jgi:protein TonB
MSKVIQARIPRKLTDPKIQSQDRLISTLLFAILIHGIVILGVGFTLPSIHWQSPLASKLEVTLVTGRSTAAPRHPDYLAQIDQLGAGNSQQRSRPWLPPTTWSLANQAGLAADADMIRRTRNTSGKEKSEPLTDDLPAHPLVATDHGRFQHRLGPQPSYGQTARLTSIPRLSLRWQQLVDPTGNSASKEIFSRHPQLREQQVAVNTRASVYAPYLYNWRLKIEQIGNLHFPDEILRHKLYGDVIIEVAITNDGNLYEAKVVGASDFPELDQAALRILRTASPFEPFTDAMRAQSDIIRFVWKWRFMAGAQSKPEQNSKVYGDG